MRNKKEEIVHKEIKHRTVLIIRNLYVTTNKPIGFMKKLEKLLRKYAKQKWNYDFRVEN